MYSHRLIDVNCRCRDLVSPLSTCQQLGEQLLGLFPASPSTAHLMNDIQTYAQEEGVVALERIRRKILGAAAAAAGTSTLWAIASQRKLIRTVPSITANVAIGMTAFAVCQEGVRGVRQGEHDAWNSFWAGGLTGAVLTRSAYGRGFHLLGLVMWGPLCGSLHWLNNRLQPSSVMQSWLASNGLLDLPQQQQQVHGVLAEQQVEAAAVEQPRRWEDLSYREKKREVELLRQREMEQLNAMLKEQEQQQLKQQPMQVKDGSSGSEQGPSRRNWWHWG